MVVSDFYYYWEPPKILEPPKVLESPFFGSIQTLAVSDLYYYWEPPEIWEPPKGIEWHTLTRGKICFENTIRP